MNTGSGGIGFFGLLQLMLIGLKLTGYTDLSWWWVLAPIIAVVGLILAIIAIAIVAMLIFLLLFIVGEG
jgi:hypothetical protein